MLPKLFTENLCSLVCDEERYTFSALFEVDAECRLQAATYVKGLIRNRANLSYTQAQDILEDRTCQSALACSLRFLLRLSESLRERRRAAGAVFLHSMEYTFSFDDQHLNPTDLSSDETQPAKSMIEEWMLFANQEVAQTIYRAFPQWALLRRHLPPNPSRLEPLNTALAAKGMHLDASSSRALNLSLERCVSSSDPKFQTLIRSLTTRCMQRANYVSSGAVQKDQRTHFGLAIPIYTHFTSPIRRYADLLVHRQLEATLRLTPLSAQHTSKIYMLETAELLNQRSENAQHAQRDSQTMHIKLHVRTLKTIYQTSDGYLVAVSKTQGYVTRKREHEGVFVFIPSLGLEAPLRGFAKRTPTTDFSSSTYPSVEPDYSLFDSLFVDVLKPGPFSTHYLPIAQEARDGFLLRVHDPSSYRKQETEQRE